MTPKALATRCVLVAALLIPLSCTRQSAPPPVATSAPAPRVDVKAAWSAYTARFIEDYFKAHPFFAVQAGRHEFDGQMDDLSAPGLAAEVARLEKTRAEAEAFDEAGLTEDQRFERQYVLSVIDGDLFWLRDAKAPFTNPAWYIDRLDPEVYLSRNYAPLETRLKGYIGYASAIPKIAADIQANLHGPLPKSLIQRGIGAFGGFAEFYRTDVPKVFASVQDPAAAKDLAAANEAAAQAMENLKSWLQSQQATATNHYALGPDLFAKMLKFTDQVDVPVANLLTLGRADLDRNTQALKVACAQYLPKGSLKACVAKMSADKPTGGAVEAARAQLKELRDFVVAKQIVSIPSDEQAEVVEAPPYNRGNPAYIVIPGPYEQGVAYAYNIAPPDPSWSAKERAEYIPGKAALSFISVHEVWPGHFLQFLHANRNPSKIAALWVSYVYAEGWAHYSEEMMRDEGLGNGVPEIHVGQLTNALLRDVRFISAIGLHTQGMTLEQSEQLFRDSAFSDPGSARQQAARGTYDPAYLNYTLGKLMIRKLRDDWIAQQPGFDPSADPKPYWRAFHDKFLSYGGPPIPLVRKAMMGSNEGSLF